MNTSRFELPLSEISFSITPEDLGRLEEGDWGKAVIGQPRALEALLMGTGIRAKGYNIFVAGARKPSETWPTPTITAPPESPGPFPSHGDTPGPSRRTSTPWWRT